MSEHTTEKDAACSDWPGACQHTPAHDNGRFTPEPALMPSDPTTPAVPTVEALSEAEREALDDAALDDIDRKAGYRVLGPGGTDGNTPTLYEVVARILAEHTERAVREALEAAAVRVEAAAGEYHGGQMLPHGYATDCRKCHMDRAARIVREADRPTDVGGDPCGDLLPGDENLPLAAGLEPEALDVDSPEPTEMPPVGEDAPDAIHETPNAETPQEADHERDT